MDLVLDFTLTDADGVEHGYKCVAHDGVQGQAITLTLLAQVVEPLGEAASALSKGPEVLEMLQKALKDDEDTTELGQLFADIDLASIGRSLRSSLLGLDPKLLRDVLRHTTRDGKALSTDAFYGAAYQRNYGELAQAIMKVAAFNRFFPLPST